MPIRSGHLYILEESSKFHTTPMNSQQLAALIAEMKTKLDTLKKLEERMDKSDKKLGQLMTYRESYTVGENSTHRETIIMITLITHPILMINFWRASRSMSSPLMDVMTHNFL